MKCKCWMIMLACAGLLLLSCHNKQKNTPEAVTEAFAKAFYTADFTHVYQYSTKKSHPVVKALQDGMKGNESKLEELKNSKVEFLEIKVLNQTDSTAVCGCNVKINDRPRRDTWDLMKESGEWKVTMVMP